MTRLPLLFFPTPERANRGSAGGGGGGSLHLPGVGRQSDRLQPKLDALQKSFDLKRVGIQRDPQGIDPEQVLVLETIGTIEDFFKAIQKIEGLDWLGEHDLEDIAPDADFYDEKKTTKLLGGRAYLVMTNQRALSEMLSLWDRYKKNPKMKFVGPDYGLAKFKDVFLRLNDVRRWGSRDRLEETGILESWAEDLRHFADDSLQVEIELWFRTTADKRLKAETSIRRLISQLQGQVIQSCTIEEICYHSLLVDLPRGAVESIVANPDVELVKNDGVMFFRPVGQMAARRIPSDTELSQLAGMQIEPTVSGEPVIAVLDGYPLANHILLSDRIRIDDPDNFGSGYATEARRHGTSMCSLVVRGDVSGPQVLQSRPVYVRPIMRPRRDINDNWVEEMPRNILVVDLIHRAVRRLFERDGNQPPVAPDIKVINLSIGDPSRPFDHFLSPLAKLLDWLSWKYRVLFVVSAGNHPNDVNLGMSLADFKGLDPVNREKTVVQKLYGDARHRRILSPAESINAITVGALHSDQSATVPTGIVVELFDSALPSPITSFGGGHRRAIKPDVVRPGGRALYRENLQNPILEFQSRFQAPGILTAVPSRQAGELNRTAHSVGTSNAAALLSHDLGICYERLLDVLNEQSIEFNFDQYGGPLLKALAVHSSDWGSMGEAIASYIKTEDNGKDVKRLISRWLGYGNGEIEKVIECTPQRATALGFGTLSDGEAARFQFPIPSEIGPSTELRVLKVTLAWFSPVFPTTQKYRRADLWFTLSGNVFASKRRDADGKSVNSGTVQHEIFHGRNASVIDENATVEIKVNCREEVGRGMGPIHFGLVVTLEVAPGINIPIYERISERIRQPTPIQPRISTTTR
jgi:hypothetical protein